MDLTKWMIENLLTESQLDVVPPGYKLSLRHLADGSAPLYTVTIVSAEDLATLQDTDIENTRHAGGRTLKNFRKLPGGPYAGGYQGMMDGDEVIFTAEEVIDATVQS